MHRLIILPAAARLVEALHTQVEGLPAAVRMVVVEEAAVVVAAPMVVGAVAEAAAAITRVEIATTL